MTKRTTSQVLPVGNGKAPEFVQFWWMIPSLRHARSLRHRSHRRSRGRRRARGIDLRHRREARYSPQRSGKGFRYETAQGAKILREPATVKRIKALAVPPAWTEVWICPKATGHIQATGRDAKGRKQYRYHARFREVRESTKYHRMLAFADSLPAIRAKVQEHLALRGLQREKVLATVVHLLEAHPHPGRQRRIRAHQQELWPDHPQEPPCRRRGLGS